MPGLRWKMAGVDRFEGHCHLDWWANSATCLASVAVSVVITVAKNGWAAEGRLVGASDEERKGFAFLCDVDPVFSLRFDDETEVVVTVHRGGGGDNFTLTEYTGTVSRSISTHTAL